MLARTINSTSTISAEYGFFSSLFCSRISESFSAALSPINFLFCLIVVSAGTKLSAREISSKPMTDISFGTFKPADVSADINPKATSSDAQNTAVGRSFMSKIRCPASTPEATEKSPLIIHSGLKGKPSLSLS